MNAKNNSYYKIGLIFIGLVFATYLVKLSFGDGDFKVFTEASKLLLKGENPYGKWILIKDQNYCLYFYSPFWATLLIPFTFLPSFVVHLLWLVLNTFFLFRIWKLIALYFDRILLNPKQINYLLFFSVILSIRFILYNIEMLQMTIFILWGILESLRLIEKNKTIKGAMLLAFIINVKILPIVIVPYLLYRLQFKSVIYILLFSMLFLVLPACFFGWNFNAFLIKEWWQVINPVNKEHLVEVDLGSHSLTALIPCLFSATKGELVFVRNLMNLDTDSAILVLNCIRLFLVLSVVFIVKLPKSINQITSFDKWRELAYILVLIPLIFPHQQKYSFLLVVPAQIYLLHFILINWSNRNKTTSTLRFYSIFILVVSSFVLMTLSSDLFIGKYWNNITQHYKFITYGALLLLPALISAKLKVNNDIQN